MDTRKLRYFVEVAERENISEAARVLNVTQPALSRQVRAFEEEMGWELLVRSGKAISLTRAGEVVMREGRRILRSVEAGEARMRREVEGAELRIGFAPSLAGGIIEKAMAVFCQLHPSVSIRLQDSTTEEMWQGVRSGTLDLIVEVATGDQDLHWETLQRRDIRVAVPKGHRLERRRKIRAEDLDGERLLLLSRVDYPNYWRKVTEFFAEHSVNAKVAGEFDGISSLSMGLNAGMGLAFVAVGSVLPKQVKVLKLDPEPEPICVAVGWLAKRKLEGWEEVFVNELKRVAVG
ncbi:LysR family transcriptional regulator [Roseibacillus persicicus]|uniref:LysR family transcriptional regulator n=1 Tax=Roseibacillus persicicus TaxID=454148 RepID=UPI00398ABE61